MRKALSLADRRLDLMIRAGAYHGLRACEISRIHHNDLEGEELRVLGKGGKTRLVPINDPVLEHAIRRCEGWLFPGRTDGHLSPGHVTKLLSEAIPGIWTAHTLRHRYGTKVYEGAGDILVVAELLGHARLDTTRRYVRMSRDKVREAARAAAA
ncbi:tyrosine-type recombinase/integrase [Devriesea agamarum]|uniref:tyrosine-type recombinase/integrase n=1 Tax=Devriesea agamarum TaxID=472569 RepID=UPI00071C41AD|nr:tyrosine-type recombinase/integrase [Devriesea agamarum]